MSTSQLLAAPKPILLFGGVREQGISLYRYSYKMAHTSVVSDHFQKDSLLIFLNVSGYGNLSYHSSTGCLHHFPIAPQKVNLQIKKENLLFLERDANQEHRFFILEISRNWLSSLMSNYPHATKREVHFFLQGSSKKTTPVLIPFCLNLQMVSQELLLAHSQKDRPALWFYAKILGLITHTLLDSEENLCCCRKERIALQRIESVKKILIRDLTQTPSLTECASAANCSAAYLSRTFSEYTGMTITRYLRNLRLEKAAELLRSGNYNVTEAAMAVGYSSLSNFSKIFADMFEMCPCSFGGKM
ncbi:MAG: helix-turn-helix transcriptional regulator [Chthoniobacterales bacterium]